MRNIEYLLLVPLWQLSHKFPSGVPEIAGLIFVNHFGNYWALWAGRRGSAVRDMRNHGPGPAAAGPALSRDLVSKQGCFALDTRAWACVPFFQDLFLRPCLVVCESGFSAVFTVHRVGVGVA